MSNFQIVKSKLEQYISRYYTNALLKGAILFFAIGLLYLLFTLFIEHLLWLNTNLRTALFWLFVIVEIGLFVKFIIIPILHLLKIRKGIDYKTASVYIGNHFPEVNDKLLNVLQLQENNNNSDLIIASIEQKAQQLKTISFSSAIRYASNVKYIKYAAIPVIILFISWLTGQMNWFNDSYERVVNYQTAYQPPAPFQFFVTNESLQTIENKDFILKVSTLGDVIPENVNISYDNQNYYLQKITNGEFQFKFTQPKKDIKFTLSANDVNSKQYTLEIVETPIIESLEMVLDYPSYTNKRDEIYKSTGSATIPEGTKITWRAKTKSTVQVNIYSKDTIPFKEEEKDYFTANKRLYNNYNYSISTSNSKLKDYEDLAYNISIIKDQYPELKVNTTVDSLDIENLYIYGQASDDYALSKLNLVYYPANDESKEKRIPITIEASNFTEFAYDFPNQLELEEGVAYNLYFEAYDNDAIHNYKKTKSAVLSYRKLTETERETEQLQEQSKTINDINKTFEKLNQQDEKLEEFSKLQKEKQQLSFNDKKKFEDFLKRQKQQEQLMKNFNKKLQDNLKEFQKDKAEDPFKKDLEKRLKENEAQLKKDEKLLKELQELKDKINKEEFSQKLEELAKQNKNKKRSMKQLLELTKRFYVMKKTEKIANQLEDLSKKQQELSEKNTEENTKEKQEVLNKAFKKLQKDLDKLQQDDRQLRKPTKINRDEFLEDEINEDQKQATESLKEQQEEGSQSEEKENTQDNKKAKDKQKQAAKKMKQLSDNLKQSAASGGGGEQAAEDIETLRQILENLLLYSFDQEDLMNTFNNISTDNNKYGNHVIAQSNLREHFEHIDDSLFALSLRQPKISERVNSQITDVYFNIDKSLDNFSENRVYQGVSAQQYAITASNELASFLSDVLDNMEMSMNPSSGQGGGGEPQLQDIIISQEELNKKMKKGLEEGEEGEKKGEEGQEGSEGDKGKKGEQGKEGEEGKEGEDGNEGNQGQQGQEGENEQQGNQGAQGENGNNAKGENGRNGEGEGGSESNSDSKEGKNGKKGNKGKNGNESGDGENENEGYGEGGIEEQNEELFKIYQQQQQLRNALEDRIQQQEGNIQSASEIIKQMEDIESDLLNYGITNQTLQKMMDVQHRLLKLENATFTQEQDSKRQSETNTKTFQNTNSDSSERIKKYFNTTEVLNRQALPLQSHLKKKTQDYFKTVNDKL